MASTKKTAQTLAQTLAQTPAQTNKQTTDKPATPYDTLVDALERAMMADPSSDACASALYAYAYATVASVLRKCRDPFRKTAHIDNTHPKCASGMFQTLTALSTDAYVGVHANEKREYAYEHGYTLRTKKNGRVERVRTDKAYANAYGELCGETLGDGYDLVQDCIVAVYNARDAYLREYGTLCAGWMRAPFTVEKLSRTVSIGDKKITPVYEDVCALTYVYRHVRRCVRASSSVQVASHKYTYIPYERDGERIDGAYTRLPARHFLATPVTPAYSKRVDAYTAGEDAYEQVRTLVDALDLSPRENEYMRLRFMGLSLSEIADRMGVKKDTAQTMRKRIAEKARKAGLK